MREDKRDDGGTEGIKVERQGEGVRQEEGEEEGGQWRFGTCTSHT